MVERKERCVFAAGGDASKRELGPRTVTSKGSVLWLSSAAWIV